MTKDFRAFDIAEKTIEKFREEVERFEIDDVISYIVEECGLEVLDIDNAWSTNSMYLEIGFYDEDGDSSVLCEIRVSDHPKTRRDMIDISYKAMISMDFDTLEKIGEFVLHYANQRG